MIFGVRAGVAGELGREKPGIRLSPGSVRPHQGQGRRLWGRGGDRPRASGAGSRRRRARRETRRGAGGAGAAAAAPEEGKGGRLPTPAPCRGVSGGERPAGRAGRRGRLRPRPRRSEGRRKARGEGGGRAARGGGGRPGLRPSERRAGAGEGARKEASAAATPGAGRPPVPACRRRLSCLRPSAESRGCRGRSAAVGRGASGQEGPGAGGRRRSCARRGGLLPARLGEGRKGRKKRGRAREARRSDCPGGWCGGISHPELKSTIIIQTINNKGQFSWPGERESRGETGRSESSVSWRLRQEKISEPGCGGAKQN